MKKMFLAALMSTSALAATAALAQTPAAPSGSQPQSQASIGDCDRLITVLEQRKPENAGVTVEQVRTFRTQNNAQACRDALVRVEPASANRAAQSEQGGEASRIVVQQPAPAIQVQQAAPQVDVRQAQPNVTVRQAQPEILVRQPQPTVTVDIPQPEIIVRMPRPEVNVAQAQPQVEVRQPQPQVQVVPQQQPQVNVTPAQPQVQMQASGGPNVQVEGADQQPKVTYERAEPKVVVNQAQGQPNIRMEQQDQASQNRQAAVQQPNQPARAQSSAATTGAVNTGGMTASRLNSMNLYNAQNENLGDIERVVQGADGKQYAIIGSGGFLGMGEKRVAIPLDRLSVRGDRVVVSGMTNDQIKAMPTFDRSDRNFREVEGNQAVQISQM